MYSVQQQIHFNSKVFGNECFRCNKGSLYIKQHTHRYRRPAMQESPWSFGRKTNVCHIKWSKFSDTFTNDIVSFEQLDPGCFSLVSYMRAVCQSLFNPPSGIIGRLCSVIVVILHFLYYFVWAKKDCANNLTKCIHLSLEERWRVKLNENLSNIGYNAKCRNEEISTVCVDLEFFTFCVWVNYSYISRLISRVITDISRLYNSFFCVKR